MIAARAAQNEMTRAARQLRNLALAQALYIGYRMYHLWATFSSWHIAGFSLLTFVYATCYFILARAAAPKYAPLEKGGALISGGTDLSQAGVIEYTWDMLYVTMFVQLATGFVSDWFWLLYTIPPSVGFYYLWTKVIYPWISKPDEDPSVQPEQKTKVKYGKGRR